MTERSEQTSKRTSELPSTLHVYCCIIRFTCRPTMALKTAEGACSPAKPAFIIPEPLSNTIAGDSHIFEGGGDGGKEEEGVHYGTKSGHFKTSKIHFPTSEGVSEVSERANE